jgi:hypothetical protein
MSCLKVRTADSLVLLVGVLARAHSCTRFPCRGVAVQSVVGRRKGVHHGAWHAEFHVAEERWWRHFRQGEAPSRTRRSRTSAPSPPPPHPLSQPVAWAVVANPISAMRVWLPCPAAFTLHHLPHSADIHRRNNTPSARCARAGYAQREPYLDAPDCVFRRGERRPWEGICFHRGVCRLLHGVFPWLCVTV